LEKFQSKKKMFTYIIKKTYSSQDTYAFFTTSICLPLKLGHYIIFEGKILGNIADSPRGQNGFGYDPLFIPKGHNKTLAEMSTNEKNTCSHRSLAINKFINFLSS